MQINTLKLNTPRKKRKTIGRGGKKGTYSGKGNKGQKARSGAHVNPLFEGGRSTLTDHLKKVRGFKSLRPKNVVVKLADLEKKLEGDLVNKETLIKSGLVERTRAKAGRIKILGKAEINKKLKIEKEILISASSRESVEKAKGEIQS